MKKILAIVMVLMAATSVVSLLTFEAKSNPAIDFKLEPLIEAPYYDDSPSLFQDSTGKIWVFYGSKSLSYPYSKKGIFYITSTDMGNNWTDETELMPAHEDGPGEYPYPNWPCAFEDSTGKIWVAWQRWTTAGQSDVYYTTSTDGGISWSNREVLVAYSGDDNNGCFIEVEGQVWYIFSPYYLSSWDVHYKVWNGIDWSDPYPITADPEPHHFGAGAIVDSKGTIWVVYERGYGGGQGDEDIWYKNSSDNGVTWSSGKNITCATGSENRPRIVEYLGTIYVFYYTGEQPAQDIWCLNSTDYGGTWSKPRQLTTHPSIDDKPWPSQIGNQLWFVWSTKRSGDYDIWLASSFLTALNDIDPDTLNLKSEGKWVTAYIELPEGYNVSDIDVSTILLNDTIPAEMHPVGIGDEDGDSIPDLMVKFSRAEVTSFILANVDTAKLNEEKFMTITLTLTGELNDGTLFQGSDTIKIILNIPGKGHTFYR